MARSGLVVLGVLVLITGLALAEEEKKVESTPEFRDKINEAACNAVGNMACQKFFQACMTPTYGLIPFFEVCANEVKVDLKDPTTVFRGFCDDRSKGLTEKNKAALKCVCDKLAVFGQDAVLAGIETCKKVVDENCKAGP